MPLVHLLEFPAVSEEMPLLLTLGRAFSFVNAFSVSARMKDN
jgi:hypothetical protein